MTPLQRNIKNRITKLTHWEYWPMNVVYLPAAFYYLYLSIKAKSLFFFSASNPSIETGGMFFESKSKIFDILPKEYLPKTIKISDADSQQELLNHFNRNEFNFPIIVKPDRGERGWGVTIVNSIDELLAYKLSHPIDFQLQEYIDYPIELSIFYFRSPKNEKGILTSITQKELLSVTGDGTSTIEQLIEQKPRALLQYNVLEKQFRSEWNFVLPLGEKKVLVPYGNHVRGALFNDYCHIIDEQLTTVFDEISKKIDGFYFGRYDLRCNSIEELKQGKKIKIVELNGAGAEPAHIYQPGFSFWKAQHVILSHFKMMYEAAKENNKMGTPYMTYQEYKDLKIAEKNYKMKVIAS